MASHRALFEAFEHKDAVDNGRVEAVEDRIRVQRDRDHAVAEWKSAQAAWDADSEATLR